MVGWQAQGGMWGSRGFIRQYRWWGHGDKADGRGHGRQRVGGDSWCMEARTMTGVMLAGKYAQGLNQTRPCESIISEQVEHRPHPSDLVQGSG
jgi:hypothetical protein